MGAVTRAAEGLDRRAFTVSEVLRMQEAGIFGERERFELIEGEIVRMQAKGPLHETLKAAQWTTHRFFEPHDGEWRREDKVGPVEALTHSALPGFSIRLSDY
jgi:hypothetical protein